MSDAVWSAQRKNKANTVNQLKKIKLHTNNAGQYQHNDVIKFIKQLKQASKEQFNPLDKKNGMFKLFERNQNFINTITMQDTYDFHNVLKKSKDKVFKASTATKTVDPDIMTRQEAQDEANRLNQIYQAVISIKEGFKEKLCKLGGINALSLVLQQAGGQHKSIDNYDTHSTHWRGRALRAHTARKPRTSSNKS